MKMWMIVAIIILVALIVLANTSFEIKEEVIIDAPKEKVWEAITRMESYSDWNTQLEYLGGTVAPDEQLHLKLSADGAEPYEFKPHVNHWVEQEKFGWIARTGLPFIFDGEHIFELKNEGNKVLLINREKYSGILSMIIKQQPMMKSAPAGFRKMNEELKYYLEKTN